MLSSHARWLSTYFTSRLVWHYSQSKDSRFQAAWFKTHHAERGKAVATTNLNGISSFPRTLAAVPHAALIAMVSAGVSSPRRISNPQELRFDPCLVLFTARHIGSIERCSRHTSLGRRHIPKRPAVSACLLPCLPLCASATICNTRISIFNNAVGTIDLLSWVG